MINPHQVYPITPKRELLQWWQGWLGLVIGSFGSAGGVADMLWVLDGRAGGKTIEQVLGALVNPYKQYQMWLVGCCTHYYAHWGDIWMGNFIFECSRVGLLYVSLIGHTCHWWMCWKLARGSIKHPLLYFSCSVFFWCCSFCFSSFGHFKVVPLFFFTYIASHISSFCTSAFHLSCWSTVFLCFFWSCTYCFIPRLTHILSRY